MKRIYITPEFWEQEPDNEEAIWNNDKQIYECPKCWGDMFEVFEVHGELHERCERCGHAINYGKRSEK